MKIKPRVEVLESRLAPAVEITFPTGSFEITDIDNTPNMTWASPSESNNNKVPQDDALRGTLRLNYSFTGPQLASVRAAAGYTNTQLISWMELDFVFNDLVATRSAVYTFHNNPETVDYAPGNWTTSLRPNIENGEAGDQAEFFARVYTNRTKNGDSGVIWLQKGALGGGAARGPRGGTAGVGYGDHEVTRIAPPTLPQGGSYAVYNFASNNEVDFQVSGFNNSAYSLLVASDNTLVFDAQNEVYEFDPGVTFGTVYASGSMEIGSWSGSGDVWALRNEASPDEEIWMSGYMLTELPSNLPTNGNTETVLGSGNLTSGNEALWLFFQVSTSETVCFLIVANSPPTIDPIADQNVDEGSTVQVTVTADDPEGDLITFSLVDPPSWAWIDPYTGVATLSPTDGPATATITVKATDDKGAFATMSFLVTVNNVAPTASAFWYGEHYPVQVGDAVVLYLPLELEPSYEDQQAGFLWDFDYNEDGDYDDPGEAGSSIDQGQFCFTTPGYHNLRGRIRDKDGGFTEYLFTILVVDP